MPKCQRLCAPSNQRYDKQWYAVTPEGEIGPFFTDDTASSYLRSNIVSNLDGTNTQVGVPLTLTITVVNTEKTCAVMQGVQVDIWQ